MADKPIYRHVFDSAVFRDIGSQDEVLELNWTKPNGQPGTMSFAVGTECFLNNPKVADAPDDQLIACLSMAAMLSSSIPGTYEYLTNMGADQEEENFQSIGGGFKIDTVSPVDNPALGGEGEVYRIKVKRVSGNDSKEFDADVRTLSDYDNVKDNFDHVALRVPAALHAQFGYKKSDLGNSGSTERTNVINHIMNTKFWS